LKSLKNEQKRKKANIVRIEGERLLKDSIDQGWLPEIITTKKYAKRFENKNFQKIFVAEEKLIKKCMSIPKLEPIIGIGKYPIKKNIDYKKDMVVFFSQDPTNIGSIIRTSLAHGIDNFLFSQNSPDPYNLIVLRTSAGASFGINYSKMNNEESLKLPEHKLILATAHSGKRVEDIELKNEKICLIFGNESKGIPRSWESRGEKITIPIKNIESLSVSAAAAIIINKITK